jgi:hypothetical protein
MDKRLDIFKWADGFWCFREEFRMDWFRDDAYSVVSTATREWLEMARQRPLFTLTE